MKRMICILLALLLLTGCQFDPAPETAPSTVPVSAPAATPDTATTQTEETQVEEPQTEATEAVFDPYQILGNMSVEELVGQLFLARCPAGDTAVAELQSYHLGGYILFGRDFEGQTPETMRQTIAAYQAASAIPLLIAVDEEGGTVCRVSSQAAFRESRFPSPRNLYDQGGLSLVLEMEEEKCRLLSSLGINVNMAPVCDITTDPDAFMYSRSLGQSPETTGEYITSVVQTMSSGLVGSVLKHFPGYGNNTDTHVGIATDSRSLDELVSADLVPFRSGIEAGCDAILISHTFIQCLDSTLPASLSPTVIGYLRNTMGFDGVVVTDDLVMQAITDLYGVGESAVLAVLAGNDLLCSTQYAEQYAAVLEAVNTGRIPLEQVKASAARILRWKYDLGLIPAF